MHQNNTTMTQTTQTTQPAGKATQETTTPPAETTQQATAPQPEQTSQQPTAKSQQPAKSAFISDGKLAKGEQEPTAKSQQPKAPEEPTANSQELIAQITALQARLDAIESQRTTETRTAEVERIIAPLSETLKAVYRRTPFATLTDEEFAKLRETISKEVTELATADKARGAVFSRPTASKPTDGKASDKETDEVLRRLNL